MSDSTIMRPKNLVLYKTQAALITAVQSKKINIQLEDGSTTSVRHKDVLLLHEGPLASLTQLAPQTGEIKTAWELLAGESSNLSELSELAYGQFTPATAWALWQHIADGLYFSGTPDNVLVHTAAAVAAELERRTAKAAEQAAWDAFANRVGQGTYANEDGRFLQEIAALAWGQQSGSKTLRALGQSETQQQAHSLLLRLGYWDGFVNPYPKRAGLPDTDPEAALPELPEEARRDLTHLAAFAIDDAGTQDPDDALSWENGRLWVHIADVAALITPDSPADHIARARAANLYLPEGTVHMLPPGATDLLALGLTDLSPALSFGLTVQADGTIADLEIVPSWVRVTRLSYAEAETRLDDSPFREMAAATQQFQARRQAQGAIYIDMPEVKIRVVAGNVEIRPLPNRPSRDLVRDAMLLTGEAVAQWAIDNSIPLPFTSQEAPVDPLPEATTPSNMLARRKLMKPSQQSTFPGTHAGLGMPRYVQATSPLRRYLDLVVHQQIRATLQYAPVFDEAAIGARIGAVDTVGRELRYTERQANQHWTLLFLQQNPEWQGAGVVVDKRGAQTTILLPELALETRLYTRRNLALDEQVRVQINQVDLANLTAHFQLIE